ALQWQALYDRSPVGRGTGLLGQYFLDPQGDLDEPPVLTRTDTTVNFFWNGASPDTLLPADYFTARWTGFVQPLFSETYAFSVSSDDGCRLWVGDSLLIDKWAPQATTQHSASVALQAGQKYRLRLEYLEVTGGANVQLLWSSPHQVREIVPKHQLYPPPYALPATLRGQLGLDADNDGTWEPQEPTFVGAELRLFDASNDSLLSSTKTLSGGRYAFTDLPAGRFYLKITLPPTADVFLPVQHVDAEGRTPVQQLAEGQVLTLNAAWMVTAIALGGDVWLDEDRDSLKDASEPLLAGLTVLLYRADSVLLAAGMSSPGGRYGFSLVSPGRYFLVFLQHWQPVPMLPGFGLNAQGQTLPFDMVQGQWRVQD
ncbi:MAG TPA: PA14 domain-containing protein, partial [Saprospiraceae bacterium]|nr:PA14 domain-containing protein [Saprospiraceae bacterium]